MHDPDPPQPPSDDTAGVASWANFSAAGFDDRSNGHSAGAGGTSNGRTPMGFADFDGAGQALAGRQPVLEQPGKAALNNAEAQAERRQSLDDPNDRDPAFLFIPGMPNRPYGAEDRSTVAHDDEDDPQPRHAETWKIPAIDGKSDILTADLVRAIDGALPLFVKGYTWKLLYSASQHGFNLGTFYVRAKREKRTMLLVQTFDAEVFGGYTSTPWEPHAQYYGTGESFIFSCGEATRPAQRGAVAMEQSPHLGHAGQTAEAEGTDGGGDAQSTCSVTVRTFQWTGMNQLFMMSTDDYIAMGGGGGDFGLLLEEDFVRGTTGMCETYQNAPLCSQDSFEVDNFELWGFDPI